MMRRAYLFIYDSKVGSRDELKEIFNKMQRVRTWRFDMPNMFYVISEYSAEELYEEFIEFNGKKGKFMFVEASSNRQGLMLSDTWYLLTHKSHKPQKK
ncbi:hypothetical protein M0G74_00845 [Microbulbifer sp. CAU 1566]|uniref:hypothetical protein n=1 Tax=Microbulbifer sp. CAU 1566 TaxID=2933269 RepID=UPI002003F65E|nr:hypothetical protein [Microbulbifer sp. CAU 1566]MCK7595811.1 hypothetical protein [Microbulbifer sp. CAU 1566]